jgi:hypothetical protein
MPTSLLALQVLLILLPGFAAAYLVQMLAVRGPQTDFDKVIEASLYSVLIYGGYSALTRGRLPFLLIGANTATPTINWYPKSLLILLCVTLLVAGAAVLYINRDGNQLLRRSKITTRTTRRSVWNDIFEGQAGDNQVVQVELDGNRSLIGILSYWSDTADENSIYVEQARWVSADGSEIPVPGPGVLLTRESKIKSISLLDDPEPVTGEEMASSD